MKRPSSSLHLTGCLSAILMIACARSEIDTGSINSGSAPSNQPVLLTQAQLDAATTIPTTALATILGDPFNGRSSQPETVANVWRELSANRAISDPVNPGAVYVLKSFTQQNGQRDRLKHVDVMIKREVGYNPGANDFEFIRIFHDSTTNYSRNPNGILPALTQVTLRGRDVAGGNCVTCHAQATAGGDFLFHK